MSHGRRIALRKPAGRGPGRLTGGPAAWPRPACVCPGTLAALGVALLVLCGTAPAQPVTSLHLVAWDTGVAGQRELLAELVRQFQRQNPGIIICTEWQPSGNPEEWLRRWTSSYREHAPDLVVVNDLWLVGHAADALPLPVDMQQDLGRRLPASVAARGGDRLRGVPWVVATEALYYRSDLMERAGLTPPTTPDELADCAERLADPPGVYGFGLPGAGAGGEDLLHVLATAAGGITADEAGAIAPAQPAFERALSLLVDMDSRGALQPEVLTWSEIELAGLFVQGRLAMMVSRPWLDTMLQQTEATRRAELGRAEAAGEDGADRAAALRAAKIEWGIAPLPVASGGAGHLAVDWLAALASTDAPEQSLKVLRFLAAEDRQRTLAMMGGVPATRALAAELRGTDAWRAHLAGLDGALGLPAGQWPLLRAQLADALSYAISGRRTPAEALEAAAEIQP